MSYYQELIDLRAPLLVSRHPDAVKVRQRLTDALDGLLEYSLVSLASIVTEALRILRWKPPVDRVAIMPT